MKGKNFSGNSNKERPKSDFYQTPYSLTRLLLQKEPLSGTIFEPANGKGAIEKVLVEEGYGVFTSDLPYDFLKHSVDSQFDTIITNPPYSLAFEFIQHAKKVAKEKIIMLLPLSYLHGKKRYDNIYQDREFPLARVYVFTRYPLLESTVREDGKHKTGMMVYAWFVWRKGYDREPVIRWLDNNPFVLRK